MSLPVCKFFRSEQGCKFGNRCRYRHSDPYFSSSNSSRKSNFQNEDPVGNTYSSPETATLQQEFSLSILSSENEVPVNTASTQSSFAPKTREFQQEPHRAFYHEEAVTTENSEDSSSANIEKPRKEFSDNRNICYHFSRFGNCRYGNRCHFQHVQQHQRQPRGQFQSFRQSSYVASSNEISDSQEDTQDSQKWMNCNSESQSNKCNQTNEDPICPEHTGQEDASNSEESQRKESQQRFQNKENAGRQKWVARKLDKICQFYLHDKCWKGAKCRFVHPKEDDNSCLSATDAKENLSVLTESPAAILEGKDGSRREADEKLSKQQNHVKAPREAYIPQGVRKWRKDEVDDVEAARLRRTEIDQLLKRFPQSKLQVKKDTRESFQCVLTFSPTDPDWPFDVRNFDLEIVIPDNYPFEMLDITLPTEQTLPETVRRYLEISVKEWLEEKGNQLVENGQVELVFRPFLRWLDKNIEDFVTDGLRQLKRELTARAAGLEFISAKELQRQYPGQSADDTESEDSVSEDDGSDENSHDDESNTDEYDSDEDDTGNDSQEEDDNGGESRKNPSKIKNFRNEKIKEMLADPVRKGTEIFLKNLQLKESVASVYFDRVSLAIHCERCKGTSEFLASAGRTNMVQCAQCGQTQLATYRPALVHNFSAVLGYLDLDACLPFDLILQNCSTIVSCLNCSKETKLGALHPGQMQNSWCRVCHFKMKISTDGVRFTLLEPSSAKQDLKGLLKVVVTKQRRIPKDPAIQEGKPLPNFGTCKHYKKSYRWLRFPCCGKCYPCDTCHDEKEDHEMKLANRMICGFCCKEQVYSADRPCKGCDLNLTKVHTQHWEGGRGCRDKTTMSRNDKHKHKNVSKTISKHAQHVKDPKSKKKIILRHT